MLLAIAAFGAVGYLLGALPFGYWVARRHGVDIFRHGSGNPGATNVRRVLGKGPGNLVFALDALKGAAAVALPLVMSRLGLWEAAAGPGPAVAGLAGALLGHSYSCFTGFRGGKGVATAVGGLAVLLPAVIAIAGVVWALVFFTTRYVSLASILGALSLPVTALLTEEPRTFLGLCTGIALFVIVRHRGNIVRLLNGTENRFTRPTAPPSPPKT
jgi:acyl phosphate:glycerol-3-phosphate acyltransferase